MSEWITDRLPTEEDGGENGLVMFWHFSNAYPVHWTAVDIGEKWKPMDATAPKRWEPQENHGYYAIRASGTIVYVVNYDTLSDEC